MGFYSASQLTQDARRHGVEVRGVDINCSDWDCTLEAGENGAAAMRLGLRMVKGLSEDSGRMVVERRCADGYQGTQQLVEQVGLDRRELGVLASAGALEALLKPVGTLCHYRILTCWCMHVVEYPGYQLAGIIICGRFTTGPGSGDIEHLYPVIANKTHHG